MRYDNGQDLEEGMGTYYYNIFYIYIYNGYILL